MHGSYGNHTDGTRFWKFIFRGFLQEPLRYTLGFGASGPLHRTLAAWNDSMIGRTKTPGFHDVLGWQTDQFCREFLALQAQYRYIIS